LAAEP